ncbi:MAG TPA: hypothetical protein VFB21_24280 [Chthonomonadaceae bacterium]|nr:hypothetical protein [Chthonomonadaceae bacterium]
MLLARRRVEKHGDCAEPEDGHQRDIEFDGHGNEDQHGVAGAQAGLLQERGGAGGGALHRGIGQRAALTALCLYQGGHIGAKRGLLRQYLGDVHGRSGFAKSV